MNYKKIMNIQRKKSIFSIINESVDKKTSLENENKFFSVIVSIPMLIGSVASFLMRYYVLNEDIGSAAFGSVFLLIFATFFFISSRIKNEKIKMYIHSIFVSVILVFTYIDSYHVIGPAVWTISFLLMIIIMIYSRIEMLIIFLTTNIILNIFNWYKSTEFNNWRAYHPSNTMILITLSFVALGVFKVFRNRQDKIIEQYNNIRFSEEKLYATLLSVGDGVITTDENGLIDYLNPIAEQLTGWDLEKTYGEKFEVIYKIINEYTRLPVESSVQKVYETKKIIELANHTLLISKDGSERPIEDTAAPIKNKHGLIVGVVLVFRDFSEKKEKRKQVEYLSYHDQLTGLYNKRFFEEELIRMDTSENLPLSFVFADVNGLKTINDAFGHQYGDLLIQQVSEVFKTICRADDIVSRTGGDEFILLFPKTESTSVQELVNRIKVTIEQKKIMDINISVAFGWDTKTMENQSASNVLKNAEDLMYRKKILDSSSKRNAVIKSILNSLRLKSPREDAHSKRVSHICEDIGKAYHLSGDEVEELRIAGELHDIGKIAVDEAILNKPSKLSEAEWTQLQHHPETGYRLLGTSSEYYNIAEYVLAHHERWDGTGYPKGLKGEAIHWKARIIGLADAYDAMTCQRPYRKALSKEEAAEEIRKSAGSQFDPDIARVFVEKILGVTW